MEEKFINAVHQEDGVIVKVELRDNLKIREYGQVKTRSEIISLLKQGIEIWTATKNNKDPFYLKKGAKVEWYRQIDGDEFIRTESNGCESDNLESLPSSIIF